MSGRLVVMVEIGIFYSDQANMAVPLLYETRVQSTNCGTQPLWGGIGGVLTPVFPDQDNHGNLGLPTSSAVILLFLVPQPSMI